MAGADRCDFHLTVSGTTYHLVLARVDNAYQHNIDPLVAQRFSIDDDPGKVNLNPEIVLWRMDSWTGGEGYFVHDPEHPTRYDNSTLAMSGTISNPRIPGIVKGPPTVTTASYTPSGSLTSPGPYLVNANSHVVILAASDIRASTDGSSWTAQTDAVGGGDRITAACSDGTSVFYAIHDNLGGLGNRQIYKMSNPSVSSPATGAAWSTSGAGNRQYRGLAYLSIAAGGRIYGWSGRSLVEYDATDAGPGVTPTEVYVTGEGLPSDVYANIITADNRVVFFVASEGITTVHQYAQNPSSVTGDFVGSMIAAPPLGFTARTIAWNNGIVYLGGDYGGKSALFGVDPVGASNGSGNSFFFFGYIRQYSTAFTNAALGAGPGTQVLVGHQNGELFVWDQAFSAFSTLANVTSSGNLKAAITYKTTRIFAFAKSSDNTIRTAAVADDTASSTSTFQLDSGVWDFDLPEHDKGLYGMHVLFKPITGSETINISYQSNESGSYTALTTINSGTSGASSGRVYIQIATANSTPNFRFLRVRIAGSQGAEIRTVTPRTSVTDYGETWDLIIRVHDETANSPRPSGKARLASAIRDHFLDTAAGLAITKNAVTFTDFARYGGKKELGSGHSVSTTHLVVVDQLSDNIAVPNKTLPKGEGYIGIRLRNIVPPGG